MTSKRRLASPVLALVALAAFSGIASAAPGTTTNTVALPATTDGAVDLPALNSQFTSMKINVKDGSANWGTNDLGYWTSYQDGAWTTGAPMTSGSTPGPLLLEGSQVGIVIYRVDGGAWHELAANTTVASGKHVQVAYNDRPGSYDDNFGSLTISVVRTKA